MLMNAIDKTNKMLGKTLGWYFEADKGAGGAGSGAAENTDQGDSGDRGAQNETETFEGWLEAQPDEVKTLYEGHTQGLRTALNTERDSRKALEKELRDLAKKAEKGSESESKLTGMADRLAETERQNTFYDAAHAAGVRNLKLAWMAANDAKLVRDDGVADFAALKERFPELFDAGAPKPKGNAGDGSRTTPTGNDFNDLIRRAAGRQ